MNKMKEKMVKVYNALSAYFTCDKPEKVEIKETDSIDVLIDMLIPAKEQFNKGGSN